MKKLTFEIRSPAIQQNAIQTIQQLLPSYDKPMIVTVQERTRSLDQNRKLWSVLHDISSQVVWHGMKLESEDWKYIFTAALKGQRSAPGINGGFVVLGQSTSKMHVGEFSELIELIHAFGAERNVKWSDEAAQALEWAKRWGSAA